jgi:DNA-nicking Smr family endonuclease
MKKPAMKRLSDDDKQLFRDSIGTVSPVASKLAVDLLRKPVCPPQPAPMEPVRTAPAWQEDMQLQAGDVVTFRADGVQDRLARRLRQGLFRPQAELDLHGLTSHIAQRALVRFVTHASTNGLRHLLIVHGKGYRSDQGLPILKNLVCHWLANCPQVLAFCSARPEDGGTGAVYVLLQAQPNPRSRAYPDLSSKP